MQEESGLWYNTSQYSFCEEYEPDFERKRRIILMKKETFVTLEQLQKIDETIPTPYHLYD